MMTALTWIERSDTGVWEATRPDTPGVPHGLYATCRYRTIGTNNFTVWAVSYADDGGTPSWGDLNTLDIYPTALKAQAAVAARWANEHPPRRITYCSTSAVFDRTDPKLIIEIADGDNDERWEIPLDDLLKNGSGANGRNLTAWHKPQPEPIDESAF